MQRADLVIANNSGVTHPAAASGSRRFRSTPGAISREKRGDRGRGGASFDGIRLVFAARGYGKARSGEIASLGVMTAIFRDDRPGWRCRG
jgi:hypothetical protein